MNHQELIDIVKRDIREGIGKVFTPTGEVRLQAAFADVTLPAADVSFVPWEYDALHDRPMHATDGAVVAHITAERPHRNGSPLLAATNRGFTIAGVTVVDARRDDVRLHRFVDWASVLANVGMGMSMRPAPVPAPV
jgi:hypothetical protein